MRAGSTGVFGQVVLWLRIFSACLVVLAPRAFAHASSAPVESPVNLTPALKSEALEIIADTEMRWLNGNGWIRLNPKTSDADGAYDNENPVLFTSEYLWLVARLGFLTGDLRATWLARLKTQLKAMELQAGLFDRYPVVRRARDVRTFSQDEQLGILTLDHLFDGQLGFASEQYEYGAKHQFLYLNAAWSTHDKFDRPIYRAGKQIPISQEIPHAQRYGAFVEILKQAAGTTTSKLSDMLVCAGMVISAKDPCDETSNRILNTLIISLLKGRAHGLDTCFVQYKDTVHPKFKKGRTCGGKPVICENAFCAMTEVYYKNESHPIRRLAELLGPDAR